MSSIAKFENTEFIFDVSIIKTTREFDSEANLVKEKVNAVIPVEPGAILNLELLDSSLLMGITGSITISNKFNILENLDITTNSPNNIFLAVQITDTQLADLDNISDENKTILVVGYINNTASASANAVDSVVIFSFEEAFVAAMKNTQSQLLQGLYNKTNSNNDTVLSWVDGFFNGEGLYKSLFPGTNDRDKTILVASNQGDDPAVKPDSEFRLEEPSRVGIIPSIYDHLASMLKRTTVKVDESSKPGNIPYFRFVNDLVLDGTNKKAVRRKLKFDAYITDRHREFVNAVKTNKNLTEENNNYSDVYLEKFTLGPFSQTDADDPNITLYNKIEKYNINRPDFGRLKKEVWGDYFFPHNQIATDYLGYTRTDTQFFSDLQGLYIEREFTGLDVTFNLPLLNRTQTNKFNVAPERITSDLAFRQSQKHQDNFVYNRVGKSFLTVNETITFTVKGSVLRTPNKFIWLERANNEDNYKKLWYVNSVKHIFTNGQYKTEIIATKIFGDTSRDAIVSNFLSRGAIEGDYPGSTDGQRGTIPLENVAEIPGRETYYLG